jgi:DNA repair exonuclease SbcCD nuclease subunit
VLPEGIVTEPGEQLLDHHLLDSRFDYIALGHIHQAQQVSANAWYSGSTERFGWNDVTAVPGYNLVTFGDNGAVDVTRIEGVSRPMIALPHVSGQGREGRIIADTVMERLERLKAPDAMVRVEVRDAGRPIRREVQSILRRESGQHVWHTDLAPERSMFQPQPDSVDDSDSPLDLHVLFHEFVSQRRAGYPNDEFTAAFLERGDRALTDALVMEEAPLPEEDNIA